MLSWFNCFNCLNSFNCLIAQIVLIALIALIALILIIALIALIGLMTLIALPNSTADINFSSTDKYIPFKTGNYWLKFLSLSSETVYWGRILVLKCILNI